MDNRPIGFFDSGIGGLSIWKAVNELLPNESTIYLADSKNAPYGEKSKERIKQFSFKNVDLLIEHEAKLIVVACNTATTNAIADLRTKYKLPFIGIEPATKPAAISTLSGKIGILATKGTFASELFLNTSQKYRESIEIIETAGTGLVQIIESGNLEHARPLLEKYLIPMVDAGVDTIVLGCTHYSFLVPIIRNIIPDSIGIIESGEAVARRTKHIIEELNLASHNSSNHTFFTNGDPAILQSFTESITVDSKSVAFLDF